MVQWKMARFLKGNDPIGDTPIFHWTMIMGERVKLAFQLSNGKNPGCLGYIGDYTTQLYRDYNKPE